MKHIFVVNPKAGKNDATEKMAGLVSLLDDSIEKEIYITKGARDAERYVRWYSDTHGDEKVRFYACGGDGTANEVASGLIGCANAEMTCIPIGSGNDYVKYYGGADRFLDLRSLMNGSPATVDVMKVNDRYSLNVCNFGFDAMVCKTMIEVRRKWLIGGRNAYTTGIVKALFKGRRTYCRISVDGKTVNDGDILLCTLGNGRYVGGAYQCSPKSFNDDGLIEVCFFSPISVLRFVRLLKPYRDGTFIDRDDLQDIMTYMRGRKIDIESREAIDLCVDGEMMYDNCYHIEQLPKAINFVVPR